MKKSNKALSALTLLAALALTVCFLFFGVKGTKLDKEGLYKLLAWIPTPSTTSTWREAIKPDANFGATDAYVFSAKGENLQKDAQTLADRLRAVGTADIRVTAGQDSLTVYVPENTMSLDTVEKFIAKGSFTFADQDGNDFMGGEHITKAAYAPVDNSMQNWMLSFEFDKEGKKVFGEKTAELVGKNVMIKKDGVMLVQAGISEPLTEGGASIPGFTFDNALQNAVMMNFGALSGELTHQETQKGLPFFGEKAQKGSLHLMWTLVAVLAVVLIVRYRVSGAVAAWSLALYMGFAWFLAGLLRRGYSVNTLTAVFMGLILFGYSVLTLYGGMRKDLKQGRSVRQALRSAYKKQGKQVLRVNLIALAVAVVVIIATQSAVGLMFRLFALYVLLGMAVLYVVNHVLLSLTVRALGEKEGRYIA